MMQGNKMIRSLSVMLIVIVCCISLTSCDFVGIDPLLTLIFDSGKNETSMRVDIDYGNYRLDLATPLLDFCETDFLDKQQWGLDVFVPGDVYRITYTGDMMVQESYPGRLVLQDGQLIDVTREDAGIVAVKVTSQRSVQSLEDGTEVYADDLPMYVILDEQGKYCELGACAKGQILYATYERAVAEASEDGTMVAYVLALYAYQPR